MEHNEEKLHRTLEDHEKRIVALEALLNSRKNAVVSKEIKTLNDHILEMREALFFSEPKVAEETFRKLQDTYRCEKNRVAVALLRLAGVGQLRKTSKVTNGKKFKAYVW